MLLRKQISIASTEIFKQIAQKKKKLKVAVLYETTNPPLGLLLNKMKSANERNACTAMFPTTKFKGEKKWKQSRFPSMNDQIKKMWHLYTMDNWLLRKKETLDICD